jgi:hypothetical protein
MSKVVAKLICTSKEPIEAEQKKVKFQAVVSGSEENKSFCRWTPSANLEMFISNETPAGDYFEEGKEYIITFDKAE